MATADDSRIETLFAQALEVAPDDRTAFLNEHCADDECRAEVISLPNAHENAGRFFADLRACVSAPALGESGSSGPMVEDEQAASPPDPLGIQGTQVAAYVVQELIGGGGMGVVYRAWDPRLERSVALTFLPPFLAEVPAAQDRFLQEAQAAARLEHPNVATIHEIDETERGRRFIVMTHYDGKTLRTQMAQDGPFGLARAVEVARTIADALHQVHRVGLVHRDVKPANVMRTAQGTLKLLDFGLAQTAATGLSVSGRRLGTPSYMSPEQADGGETGPHTDLWALGVMLYEMLTGKRPFSGDRPLDILDAIRHDDLVPV
ncbi:MAG: hypothetical protein BRD55_11945 [Bacteroidetes bacterium SW_9_63_38]|nr:MAG: hypothetical protein BRD55_11945 [Bacteroidetes bacterium SW_9_63_38]